MNPALDGRAIEAAFAQPDSDGNFTGLFADYLQSLGMKRPVLFFAFAPKAAGTFLRSAAIEAVGGQLVRIVHAQGGRDAQPYMPIFINYFLGGLCDGPLVAHAHMQALPANRKFLEAFGIKPIIMLRSLPDMLASYWDMLAVSAQARADGLNCPIPDAFPSFSDEQKAGFMIDMIAPWYVHYFASWRDYARVKPDDVCLLHYADLLSDPAHVLETALDHADLTRSPLVCRRALDDTWKDRAALRFNKGITGRGHEYFSNADRQRLMRMLDYYPALSDWRDKLL